jgi:hypothetical protein
VSSPYWKALNFQTVAYNSARLNELQLKFSLSFSPFCQEGKDVLVVIAALKNRDILEVKLSKFSERVSLLLKHDWERVKHEAMPWLPCWYPHGACHLCKI